MRKKLLQDFQEITSSSANEKVANGRKNEMVKLIYGSSGF